MSLWKVFSKDRQVIPRWHTYPVAKWLRVTASQSAISISSGSDDDYQEKVDAWQKHGDLAFAADLVGNAIVLNRFTDKAAISAAEFILENKAIATGPLLDIASNLLRFGRNEQLPIPDLIAVDKVEVFWPVITRIKSKLKEYPRNPILWMDMAFYYSAIGQSKVAQEAVRVALSLNSENRYLLRSGARFFMHIGLPDEALKVLHHSNAIKYDPWVVAAEIAISSTVDRSSRHIKRGRELIETEAMNQFHLSELACALGTIELRDGARKKGRRLFELALMDPTENTLAQAAFLKDELGDVGASIRVDHRTHSFEAETRLKLSGEDFPGALESAKKWLAYQPFSSRPAVGGSYIAAVALCEYEDAVRIARIGLISSPKDVLLRNNLAFSLASLGDVETAKKVMSGILDSEATESEQNTLRATRALIEFRDGNMQEGRRLYSAAAEFFKRQKDYRSEAIAVFFWAREEALSRTPLAEQLLNSALSAAAKMGLGELLAASKAMPPLI